MDIKTNKCKECKYELENSIPISYNQFEIDFEIQDVSGDTLSCAGIAKCKTCNFSVDFMQECLIYEKLYLIAKKIR